MSVPLPFRLSAHKQLRAISTRVRARLATQVVIPLNTDTILSCADAIPSRTEAIPSRTDTIPMCTDTIPRRTEAIPRCTEAIPRCTEAIPMCTEAIPSRTDAIPGRAEPILVGADPILFDRIPTFAGGILVLVAQTHNTISRIAILLSKVADSMNYPVFAV
jgi:hypothetical protein